MMPSTPETLRCAQQIFDDALARGPTERAAFVAELCGHDGQLRAEVESLLASADSLPADFMRPPEFDSEQRASFGAEPDALLGRSVAGYHVERIIGTGGMGTVYEAVQDEPRRSVALKVMSRHVASHAALRRFRFEAEVLGRLRHPNIAQVYQAGMHGTGNARAPFFAMEFVPGARPITRFATDERLTTRARLRLFAKVCEAVQHGHQNGIIHRDLKPANILVDTAGEPKVIDFGVARSTDSDVAVTTMRTDVGQLIGTLQYMSPEQCDADPHDLDTRSDVYSLGAVLFELLTGERPYEATGTTIVQAAQIIKTQPPRPLSAVDPKLRGDIETIVAKALEKDRERRYQTASNLAQDVRRYLAGEPVEARPNTVWTRVLRWVTRHPALSTASVCLGIGGCIVAATFVAVWLLNLRPHKIELNADRSEARLLALNGALIRPWSSVPGGIHFAELITRPSEFGGGRVGLIGFGWQPENAVPRALCAYDLAHDSRTPIWARRVETEDILAELRSVRGFVREEFFVNDVWTHDVFPERPGAEVITVFAHVDNSRRILRIYDLAGELLYQVWHDGGLGCCYWMTEAELLLFSGRNCAINWSLEGKRLNADPDPRVVAALRPRVGQISNDYFRTIPGSDPAHPAWYLQLQHDHVVSNVSRIQLACPHPPHDARRCVTVCVQPGPGTESVTWVIDESGREVPGSRIVGDPYQVNRALPDDDPRKLPLPDPHAFHLAPLQPAQTQPAGRDAPP